MTVRKHYFSIFFIIMIFVFSYFLFVKGVNDSFYFDDHINLDALATVQGSSMLQILDNYLLANGSGPLGRPVSMISFLIDDNSWPSNAGGFKRTNIKIHILVGLFIFWLSYLLLSARNYRYPAILAGVAALFWLLNPLHLSTVYYPVQRMTQLAALFSILSIIIYVKGRMVHHNLSPLRSLVWFFGVGFFALTAVLSKENAAILPLLVLIVEGFIGSRLRWNLWPRRPIVLAILVIGSLFVAVYITYMGLSAGFFDGFDKRNFSPYERLLTQFEVIVYYLKELFVPSLYTPGIFYDDWEPARSFTEVIPSFLLFFTFILASFALYLKGYLTGLAGLFFFSAHLVESSVVNLELVFEHRNYLPSALLGFVFVDLFCALKRKPRVRILVLIFPLLVVAGITYERANLWRDRIVHSLYMAEASPHSIRSQVELYNALLSQGMLGEAKRYINRAVENNPNSLYLRLHSVMLACAVNSDANRDGQEVVRIAGSTPFDGRQILGYRKLMKYLEHDRCDLVNSVLVDEILRAHLNDAMVEQTDRASLKVLYSLAGRFYALYPNLTRGAINIDPSVSNDPEYVMSLAASLATSGNFSKALQHSRKAEDMLLDQGQKLSPDNQRLLENIREFQKTVRSDMGHVID